MHRSQTDHHKMVGTISLDEEARLYQTNSERERYESLATFYGIIIALEYVERAYVRDAISAAQYGPYLGYRRSLLRKV